jgi:hypothetical protein
VRGEVEQLASAFRSSEIPWSNNWNKEGRFRQGAINAPTPLVTPTDTSSIDKQCQGLTGDQGELLAEIFCQFHDTAPIEFVIFVSVAPKTTTSGRGIGNTA